MLPNQVLYDWLASIAQKLFTWERHTTSLGLPEGQVPVKPDAGAYDYSGMWPLVPPWEGCKMAQLIGCFHATKQFNDEYLTKAIEDKRNQKSTNSHRFEQLKVVRLASNSNSRMCLKYQKLPIAKSIILIKCDMLRLVVWPLSHSTMSVSKWHHWNSFQVDHLPLIVGSSDWQATVQPALG